MPKDKVELDKKQVKEAQEKEKKVQKQYQLDLTEAQQTELVERVVYLVEKDEADRKEYIDVRKKVRDMYEGKVTVKNDPWKGCANVKTQLVHMSCELLHSRLFPASYNEDLIYYKPMEKGDVENIENVNKFMGWVIRDMKLASNIDDGVHNLILDGTVVFKIRWVPEYKWVQRKILIEESKIQKMKRIMMRFIGGNKEHKIPEKKYKVEYEYKKFESCKVEVCDLEDVGFPTYMIPSSTEEDLEYIWHRTYPSYSELKELEAMGNYKNIEKIGTYLEGLLTEGTKKSTLDAEGTKITQNKLNYKCEVIEFYDKYDYNNDGVREDIIVTIEKKSRTFLDARSLLAISRINERPFVIGQFIRRTNRMLGKGAGEIAMPFEEEANAIHNQRLDAGTMSIIPFGVYRSGSGFKPENIELEPGLWVPVDDINDAKWVSISNNVMVSFQEERMLMELLEKVLSVGSYQSGQESDTNRSRSTARGTLAIIQQGEIRFAILGKRVQAPISRVLNKILHQYQDKMPPGLAGRVLGGNGEQLFPDGIAPEDLAGNYDSYLVLDSTGGSKQADRQIRESIYLNFSQNPLVMQNMPGFWQLSADTLKATGLYDDVEQILGAKPVQNPLSKNVADENYLMMQGQKVEPSPTDNVIEHLMGHFTFRDSVEFVSMPLEYRGNFDAHIEATKQQIKDQVMKMVQANIPQPEGVGQLPPPQPGEMNGNQAGTDMGNAEQPGLGTVTGAPGGGMPTPGMPTA
jgi:hypothetical protein